MKVTIVVDNIEHAGIPGEWGFCAYIEQNGKKLLLDTGASNLFAENAGVVLLEVRKGYSKAKLEIKPEHLNAGARTQGGAIFTLADLALAAAANSHGTLAFSLSSTITFLRASGPGDTLFAEARERYIGRSTGCYQVDITNQDGELIATFESSVFRKDQKVPFEVQE